MFFMFYICRALDGFEEVSRGSLVEGAVHAILGDETMELGHAVLPADGKEAESSARSAHPQNTELYYLQIQDLATQKMDMWLHASTSQLLMQRLPTKYVRAPVEDDRTSSEAANYKGTCKMSRTGCSLMDNAEHLAEGGGRCPQNDHEKKEAMSMIIEVSQIDNNTTFHPAVDGEKDRVLHGRTRDEDSAGKAAPLHYHEARDVNRDEGTKEGVEAAQKGKKNHDKGQGMSPEMCLPSFRHRTMRVEDVDRVRAQDPGQGGCQARQVLASPQENQSDDLCLMQRRKRDRSPTPRRRRRHAWSEDNKHFDCTCHLL